MAFSTGLDTKPWYYAVILGLLVGVVAGLAVHYLLVTGINEEIAGQRRQLDELATKIANGRSAEKKLPQFREEVARLELELEKLRRILPSTRNTDEIIRKIKSLVDQGDFSLKKIDFPTIDPASGGSGGEAYAEWPISISIEGGYHNLAILFNRLGNFSRIVNVESFTITALPNQATRTITTDFIAKTFVYIEPAAPAEPAAEATGAPAR